MSAGDRDTLALVLAKHRWDRTEAIPSFGCKCECGEPVCTPDGGQSHDWHFRSHVADVLLASDWLREQRAEAWLQGHLKGMHHTHPEICDDEICPNPYRTTEDTDAH